MKSEFIEKNSIETYVLEIAKMLSEPQCVKGFKILIN